MRMLCLALLFFILHPSSFILHPVLAQGGVQTGPEVGDRDPELEKKATHNVEVAEFYLKKRKAYKAAIERLTEIKEIYPQFTRLDKVLLLLGEAQLGLDKPAEAKANFKELVEKFPDSDSAKAAKKHLEKLK